MGSGDKFSIGWNRGFGIGFHVDKFPHQLSINIQLIKISIYIGFGKGYDER
jgi:hypothetical protein